MQQTKISIWKWLLFLIPVFKWTHFPTPHPNSSRYLSNSTEKNIQPFRDEVWRLRYILFATSKLWVLKNQIKYQLSVNNFMIALSYRMHYLFIYVSKNPNAFHPTNESWPSSGWRIQVSNLRIFSVPPQCWWADIHKIFIELKWHHSQCWELHPKSLNPSLF